MAIKVIVPNKNFNGLRGGVQFKNGQAVFEDEEKGRKLAEDLGYAVEEIEKKSTPKKTTKSTAKKTTTKKKSTSSKTASKKDESK